jgi:hypothetical protein
MKSQHELDGLQSEVPSSAKLLVPARYDYLGALDVSYLHPLHTSWGKISCPPINHQINQVIFLKTSIVPLVCTNYSGKEIND